MVKKFKEKILVAIFMILAFIWPVLVAADDFQSGVAAYNEGRYADAAKFWKKVASKAGDTAIVQYNLATLYETGQGVERHLGKAAYYLKLSAEQGYTPAKFRLGQLYFHEDPGFPKNVNAALFWWESAAKDGDVDAQLALATLFLQGVDVQKDLLVARHWLQVAADKNDPRATALLQQLNTEAGNFRMYDAGWIMSQDPKLFTIELFGSSSKDEAEAFAYRNGLEFSAVYKSIYGDYIVIAGLFESLEAAYAQIESLPDVMKAFKPRPRSLAVLMAELNDSDQNTGQMGSVSNVDTTPVQSVISVLGAEWIRKQNPIFYTVQLYESNSRDQAELFVQEAGIDNAAMYRTVGGQYVIIAGVFSDLQQAEQGVTLLPRNLQSFNPSPRIFAEIKRDLLLAEDNALNPRNPVNEKLDILDLSVPAFSPAVSSEQHNIVDLTTVPRSNEDVDPEELEAIGVLGRDVILSLPSEKFTIELYKGNSINGIGMFMKQYGIETGAVFASNDGHYSLISGLLNSEEDAIAEINTLPPSIREYSPIIRQIAVVQSEIASNEKVSLNTGRGLEVSDNLSWQWILSNDPRRYTILMFESPSFFGAQEFVKKFRLRDIVIYKSRKGRNPYRVVSGTYDTVKQVNFVKNRIAKRQQKVYRPDRKKFSTILKEMADPWDQPGSVGESLFTGFFPYTLAF